MWFADMMTTATKLLSSPFTNHYRIFGKNIEKGNSCMKCVICHGEEIIEKKIDEELKAGDDIVLAPITCLVCQTCGERYYDTATMRHLERLRVELRTGHVTLKQVGKVLMIEPTPKAATWLAV
jgi:YgiT-type zinc finger domain-containing protein